jgi:hypothetical protein
MKKILSRLFGRQQMKLTSYLPFSAAFIKTSINSPAALEQYFKK